MSLFKVAGCELYVNSQPATKSSINFRKSKIYLPKSKIKYPKSKIPTPSPCSHTYFHPSQNNLLPCL